MRGERVDLIIMIMQGTIKIKVAVVNLAIKEEMAIMLKFQIQLEGKYKILEIYLSVQYAFLDFCKQIPSFEMKPYFRSGYVRPPQGGYIWGCDVRLSQRHY